MVINNSSHLLTALCVWIDSLNSHKGPWRPSHCPHREAKQLAQGHLGSDKANIQPLLAAGPEHVPLSLNASGLAFHDLCRHWETVPRFSQTPSWLLLLLVSRSVLSDSLRPYGLQQTRLPCPSPSPGVCPNSCPLIWRCHPPISSSVASFSSCLQSFLAAGSFPKSWLFSSGGQSIGASASASVLPMNIQG